MRLSPRTWTLFVQAMERGDAVGHAHLEAVNSLMRKMVLGSGRIDVTHLEAEVLETFMVEMHGRLASRAPLPRFVEQDKKALARDVRKVQRVMKAFESQQGSWLK